MTATICDGQETSVVKEKVIVDAGATDASAAVTEAVWNVIVWQTGVVGEDVILEAAVAIWTDLSGAVGNRRETLVVEEHEIRSAGVTVGTVLSLTIVDNQEASVVAQKVSVCALTTS